MTAPDPRLDLDAIKTRIERLDYAIQHGSSDALHVRAVMDLKALHHAVTTAQKVHEPIDAMMYTGPQQRIVKVCTGCGTDDGNWQRWPCPTINALEVNR